jgi:hypothetical protein
MGSAVIREICGKNTGRLASQHLENDAENSKKPLFFHEFSRIFAALKTRDKLTN